MSASSAGETVTGILKVSFAGVVCRSCRSASQGSKMQWPRGVRCGGVGVGPGRFLGRMLGCESTCATQQISSTTGDCRHGFPNLWIMAANALQDHLARGTFALFRRLCAKCAILMPPGSGDERFRGGLHGNRNVHSQYTFTALSLMRVLRSQNLMRCCRGPQLESHLPVATGTLRDVSFARYSSYTLYSRHTT